MKKWMLALALVSLSARAEREDREQDDPRGRIEARSVVDGVRSPEEQLEILRTAEAEAVKYGLRPGAPQRTARAAGAAWINLGPTSADFEYNGDFYSKVDSGRLRKVLVDPRNQNVVYVATSGGGVWKTYDATTAVTSTTGPHWQAITDGIGSLSIGSLAMSPANPDSLLLGLGDPFDVHSPGFLHSDDGGASWSTAVALSGIYTGTTTVTATSVREIAFDPGGAIVLVATNAGLFRSTEGGVGTGWTLIKPNGSTLQDCWTVQYAAANTWLAGCVDDPVGTAVGKLYRSTDGGASFGQVTTGLTTDMYRLTVAVGPSNRAYLLASDGNNADQKDVYKSTDAGQSWTSLSMAPGGRAPVNPTDDQPDLDFVHDQAFYNHMLVVDPVDPNTLFIGGNLSMGRSTDGGTSWTVLTDWLPLPGFMTNTGGLGVSQYAHADWHTATLAHFGTTTYFYGGNDGGLIRATDNGTAGVLHSASAGSIPWEDKLNRGMVTHLVYSVSTGKERPTTACTLPAGASDLVYGGFQDNGTRIRVIPADGTGTGPTAFNQIVGGDGFGVGMGCTGAGAAMGSNLISTYASQIRYSDTGAQCRTTSSGSSFNCFTVVVKGDGTGLNPSIALDGSYTFVMKIATDLTADKSYLTPLTQASSLAGHVYKSTDGGHTWNAINGTIHRAAGTTATSFPLPMSSVLASPRTAGLYVAAGLSRAYVTIDGGANWYETAKMASTTASNYLKLSYAAVDPNDSAGKTIWVSSKATSMSPDGAAIPAGTGHLFKCTVPSTWTTVNAAVCAPTGNLPASLPVNVVKVDPGDSATIYAGTELGLYRSIDGGVTFSRYGVGLPLVSVTDIAINADGSAVRVATYGRGFWEINNSASAPAGVAGNGDFDGNQVIDGFDLVREAAVLLTDGTMADYNATGNLSGTTNAIDNTDLNALYGKLGGRP